MHYVGICKNIIIEACVLFNRINLIKSYWTYRSSDFAAWGYVINTLELKINIYSNKIQNNPSINLQQV